MHKKYGDEWEKEVMRNPKKTIVEMLRRVAIERDRLEAVEVKEVTEEKQRELEAMYKHRAESMIRHGAWRTLPGIGELRANASGRYWRARNERTG